MPDYEDSFDEDKNLAYDLRQRYAKLVGDHLEIIAHYRLEKAFPDYFNALENLYTITQHKFKDKPKHNKKNTKYENITYDMLRKKVIEVSNRYSNTWNGNSLEPDAVGEILKVLREVEMFLYFKMDEAEMFGSYRDIESLI